MAFFMFDSKLYNAIEQDLGEITDIEILPFDGSKHLKFQLNYKSNGVLKSDYFSDLQPLIACMYYVNELINPLKKYPHGS